MRARHVFISYSRTDHEYLERLSDHLQESGLAVWTDWGIEPGTSRWTIAIRDHIDRCIAFVVVMTPEAEESEWVGREIRRAQTKNKTILPLLLGGDEFFVVTEHQSVDVSERRMPPVAFIRRLAHLTSVAEFPMLVSSAATAADLRDEGSRLFSLVGWTDALAAQNRAIALDHVDPNAHTYRGWALTELGRLDEAMAAFDRAIPFDRTDPVPHSHRGWVLAKMGRHEEAQVANDRARDFGSTSP